ncbi:type II inositol 1,4,5-trisphosphate 5-phosphatase-like [Oppia nitens]|uniref:type II inositol 1,4,5-trisphosphate 5-phosphatase-like n=1 Tax=Oppia nitens TaxID=1686743 RepID=UPI0023D98624|nr:type II inositol 1,4,5-trisphosphate 5-phosphatase-like [Oppia nitens]
MTNNSSANLIDFDDHHFDSTSDDWTDVNSAVATNSDQNLGQNFKANNVGKSSFYGTQLDSPINDNIVDISRHEIATGATPLAARESVIRAQMVMREDKYTHLENYRLFVGTWNVNGQNATQSLHDWLARDPNPPDIYALGFQELDLSTEAFVFNESPKQEMWFKACREALHPKATYELVRLVRLVGMMLVVFIKAELKQFVSHVTAEMVGTGLMGRMGNKGGVAIRFDFHSTSICLVNSHLAAHVEEYERRNQDYNEICSRLIFNYFKPPKYIKDHDHIYWFGDLNYRLMDLSTEQVKNYLNIKAYQVLLEHDQLKVQINCKNVFVGYTEGDITYLPTYKYDPGTDNWDSSEKSRPPAWCDRVLWRSKEPTKQLAYRSHPTLLISDHKPVSGLFDVSIKVIDNKKYRKIYEEVMKKLDQLENEFLPQVTVDKMEVNFDFVTFGERQSNLLTVANTGQVPLTFEFIKKPNDVSYCKPWLQIKPYTSKLMPGDSLDVELEAFVDKTTAYRLNSGADELSDIIVLHLDGGKDLFITITGTYQRSCYGCSIDTLVRLKQPLKQVSKDVVKQLELKQHDKWPAIWDIPKELWIIVDQLYKYGMLTKELFQQSGLITEFCQVRKWLDMGYVDKFNVSIYSVAEALIIFLESLSEPVVPYNYYARALEGSSNFILCKQVVQEMPEHHRNVFYYLIAFLRELLRHSNTNKLDSKLLASIFGSVLLRSPINEGMGVERNILRASQQSLFRSSSDTSSSSSFQSHVQSIDRKKDAFVFHFLVNDFDI